MSVVDEDFAMDSSANFKLGVMKMSRHTFLVLFILAGGLNACSANTEMKCSDPEIEKLRTALKLGDRLESVVQYLDSNKIPYLMFSGEDRVISMSLVVKKGFAALQPIEIIVRGRDTKESPSVTGSELLTFDFDNDGRASKVTCEKVYTGP